MKKMLSLFVLSFSLIVASMDAGQAPAGCTKTWVESKAMYVCRGTCSAGGVCIEKFDTSDTTGKGTVCSCEKCKKKTKTLSSSPLPSPGSLQILVPTPGPESCDLDLPSPSPAQ